jgi:hypothetical protein
MCELLVRVVDKIGDDPYHDSKCSKRGDVIVVMPDGHQWGRAELLDPFLVLRLPLVSSAAGESFLGREHDTDPTNPSLTLQRRAFRLDLDALPSDPSAMTDADLLALKRRKPALSDPNVFEAG